MDNILEVKDLRVDFHTSGRTVSVVDGISFNIRRREIFGLVGESGSGKTMTALSIMRLIKPPGKISDGSILFNGTELLDKDEKFLRAIRGSKVSIVFQEPSAALDPVFTLGYQVTEAVAAHQHLNKAHCRGKAMEYLRKVHIQDPERVYASYPHQLSGGTKQRAMIAMALVNSPELLILDEPTTALDVTIQAEILELLEEIKRQLNISMLFISHDFGIISRMCGRVGVMHKGKIVESGDTMEILRSPKENYTRMLLESVKALERW
jgi:ABC-type dipeptide/oligopeptide/nickel transport system ATPase component